MKSQYLTISSLLMFLLVQAVPAYAVTSTFTVSATLPLATTVNITPSSVNSTTGAFTAVTGTALSFDPLTFNTTNSIWLPNHFFAIDVAPAGAGSTNTTVSYTEGANPNAATGGTGLGVRSTATFVKVSGTTETGLTAHGPKKRLIDVTAENILPAEVSGGFLRIYVGIVTKDPTATFPDPANSLPFTNADTPGAYNGSLVITSVPA